MFLLLSRCHNLCGWSGWKSQWSFDVGALCSVWSRG